MKCIFSNCAAGKKSASLSASIGKCSAKASTQRRYWVKHHHGNTNPGRRNALHRRHRRPPGHAGPEPPRLRLQGPPEPLAVAGHAQERRSHLPEPEDRKSTRLNSSHLVISYAVFCLKKKNKP